MFLHYPHQPMAGSGPSVQMPRYRWTLLILLIPVDRLTRFYQRRKQFYAYFSSKTLPNLTIDAAAHTEL